MTSRDYLVTVWCDKDPEPQFDEKTMKYLMYQKEECPSTGRLHWQTYVIFKDPCRIRGCQKRLGLGKQNKVIKPRGSSESCAEYCSKQKTRVSPFGDRYEFGELESIQGRRTDIETVAEEILKGATKTDIAMKYPTMYIKYHGGIEKLIQQVPITEPKTEYEMRWDPVDFNEKSIVILGPSGCGKTEYALGHFKNALFVTHMDDLIRFNKDVHDGIIFDDMDFRHMPRTSQIHLTDWNQSRSIHCRYQVAIIPKATKKIFTGNEYMFIDDAAIRRRVTVTKVD